MKPHHIPDTYRHMILRHLIIKCVLMIIPTTKKVKTVLQKFSVWVLGGRQLSHASSEEITLHTLTRNKFLLICSVKNQYNIQAYYGCKRRGSAAARLRELRGRIPPWAWMSLVSIVCCQDTSLHEPIIRPEKSYRLWRVTACNLQTSKMRRSWPSLGCCARENTLGL
jgi:hypothetical protein